MWLKTEGYRISYMGKYWFRIILTIKLLGELIMKKVSKETKKEQRYNANLHKIFVKAQKEINANE